MQESRNFCSNCFTQLSIDLDGIWNIVETCLCDESHSFYRVHSVFKGENPAEVIWLKENLRWLVFRHLKTEFFQTWYCDRDH